MSIRYMVRLVKVTNGRPDTGRDVDLHTWSPDAKVFDFTEVATVGEYYVDVTDTDLYTVYIDGVAKTSLTKILLHGSDMSPGKIITATAADTTPDVEGAVIVHLPDAVMRTNFDSGTDGQRIWVIADVANCGLTHDATKIHMGDMALNLTFHTANSYAILRLDGTVWRYETHYDY